MKLPSRPRKTSSKPSSLALAPREVAGTNFCLLKWRFALRLNDLLLPLLWALLLVPWFARAQTYSVLYALRNSPDGAGPLGLARDDAGNLYGTASAGGLSGCDYPENTCGAVFELGKNGKERLLLRFDGSNGNSPTAGLARDTQGNLYGTTSYGGPYGAGEVFKVNKGGETEVLYGFRGSGDGGNPWDGVVLGKDDAIYGTTVSGGNGNYSTLFKLDTTGREMVLHTFHGNVFTRPTLDAQNNLFGVTFDEDGNGTVYEFTKSGRFNTLYVFTGGADGAFPNGSDALDKEGNFYGTTVWGGAYQQGVLFEVDKRGKFGVLHTFTGGADGGMPRGAVFIDEDGTLYGTATSGGLYGRGSLFTFERCGKFKVLHNFLGGADGADPQGDLFADESGNLYGTTLIGGDVTCFTSSFALGCGTVFKLSSHEGGMQTTRAREEAAPSPSTDLAASGQTVRFKVLHSFTGSADGAYPYGALLLDGDGRLYGTTYGGGTSNYGVVFAMNTAGRETVLHSFAGAPDGAYPYASLLQDPEGNLYGTTYLGGVSGCGYPLYLGCGTIFKLAKDRQETVLYSFCADYNCPPGAEPITGLVRDSFGNLYGTSTQAVFKLDVKGELTDLAGADWTGYGTLIRDSVGNLYDTAAYSGDSYCNYPDGCGFVFEVSAGGSETVLHSFTGAPDGAFPYSGLVMDKTGALYGTTSQGGKNGAGAIFKLDADGEENVIHSFSGIASDGANPVAGLVSDGNGSFYGTTLYGGSHNMGTVFKLNKEGKLTTLHCFNGLDGQYPFGELVLDAAGNLFGSTPLGGRFGAGAVFMLTP